MSETRWPSPSPPPEPVLTLVVADDAEGASAWINRFAVEHAGLEPHQRFAFWVPDPAARRSELMALAPSMAEWIDQRFSFHQLADLVEDMTRPPIAKRMVIDPFDPHRDWKVGYATENEHVGGKFDRLRAFAAPHQARLWLVGRPLPKFDLRPTAGMWRLLEERAKTETGIVRMGRPSAQEALEEASVEYLPPPPFGAHHADAALFIGYGKAFPWRLPRKS